jgi:hypothetical protein
MNTNEPQILMTRKHLAKADHVSSTVIAQRPRPESAQNNIRGFPDSCSGPSTLLRLRSIALAFSTARANPSQLSPAPPPASTYRMTNRASLRRLTRFLGGGYTP